MKNVALIGIGPHAKRIYLHYFKKKKVNLELVVDLESEKDNIRKYLDENGFKKTKIFTLSDKYKDDDHLPEDVSSNLLAVCKTLEITHLIISTEPKAHFMYLEFALKNNMNVLTDKPITVAKNMTSLHSIDKVRKQYYEILDLAKKSKGTCKVMCQRQYHRGYEKIKDVLTDVVNKYKMPITNIDIFHSDGAWEMPHDLGKENHPYKYGYGKLFHSGYHFIDLLSDFIKINDSLGGNKKIVDGDVYSKVFIPNDALLDCNENMVYIITGPNMAGKSTFMRQVAIIVIMAQIGCFVPAKSAIVPICDTVFTRVGASDDLSSGRSTFMVEMSEVSEILQNATSKSLVILDEIGRGTSTYDGMSIAKAVVEYIINPQNNLGCKTLFATHYHELTEMENNFHGVINYNIAVKKRGDDITFLRKIVRGGADDSYGIQVAKLAGVPDWVIQRAKEILKELVENAEREKMAVRQLSLDDTMFTNYRPA